MSESNDQVRATVRDHYAQVAEAEKGGCAPGCCGVPAGSSLSLGYSAEDLASVPEGADLGLGCGNPQAIAKLRPGETVVDLGSGAGFDCFLAARQVGDAGKVIGVDMTPSMLEKARKNARSVNATNVEFRLGEIEHLPVANDTADVILSNCVINLSPDKVQVLKDAFRVLKPGGRLAVSDVVALGPIPEKIQKDALALAGCVAGAADVKTLEDMLRAVGFEQVSVVVKPESREFIQDWLPGSGAEEYVASANITAQKPKSRGCC
ncbi:MAG: arsenite methyltransferase [Myxococcales bacterium]|nr:arsenite methyltransferase [Myxococcales bacterium]MCB9577055.1 arsenite methyltransferase [Polyangiaceae bacterium]